MVKGVATMTQYPQVGETFEYIRSEVFYKVVSVYQNKGEVRLHNHPCRLTKQVPVAELNDPKMWRKVGTNH